MVTKMKTGKTEKELLVQYRKCLLQFGFLPDQYGRFWKEKELKAKGIKFHRIIKPCPIDGKDHAWPSYTFLPESQRVKLGIGPKDLVCRKCNGLLEDYLMLQVDIRW